MAKAKIKPELAAEAFNKSFPVGSKVLLKKDFEDVLFPTETTSEAWVMCESPVVMLKGVSGAYHIRCVTAAQLA